MKKYNEELIKKEETMKKELPKYFVIKQDNNNPLWDKYIQWLNTTYKTRYDGMINNFYGFDGNFRFNGTDCWDEICSFKNNPTLLTLEEWDSIVNNSKQDNMKEIIGYKLNGVVSKEIADRVLKWQSSDYDGLYFIKGHIGGSLVAEAKRLDILDKWFEPVYKQEEKVISMGSFNLTIKPEGIFHKNENITNFVEEMMRTLTPLTNRHNKFNKWTYNIENITFNQTGCEGSKTTYKQWEEVWKTYHSLK